MEYVYTLYSTGIRLIEPATQQDVRKYQIRHNCTCKRSSASALFPSLLLCIFPLSSSPLPSLLLSVSPPSSSPSSLPPSLHQPSLLLSIFPPPPFLLTFPASMTCLIRCPRAEPDATTARSMSPYEGMGSEGEGTAVRREGGSIT